jgi:ribosomal protein S18 acetylase RimI-like enzyme
MSLIVRTAARADVPLLSFLGRETFVNTFVKEFSIGYSDQDLAEFLEASYGEAAIDRYFDKPDFQHFVAEKDGQPIGYALVGTNGLEHEDARPGDGELKRIYLLPEAKGSGAGQALYEASMAWLEKDGPRPIWLGVWSLNIRAQRFYEKNGFEKVGEYFFIVGQTRDHEFIFRRP